MMNTCSFRTFDASNDALMHHLKRELILCMLLYRPLYYIGPIRMSNRHCPSK